MTVFRLALALGAGLLLSTASRAESFRVLPYVQNPAPDAMTVRWLSETSDPGTLTVETPDGPLTLRSRPETAPSLVHNPFKPEPGGPHPPAPWIHRVRVTGLKPETTYKYTVRQGAQQRAASFRTAPSSSSDSAVRFIVYSDPETEPESTTAPPVDWPASPGGKRPQDIRKYLADQTTGYRENLRIMASRGPNFIVLPGDLVETGGEQRDWDEFWRHNAGDYGNLGSSVPIFAALGNHENYAGPGGGYSAEGANFATDKFLTYFEVPSNGAASEKHRGRYYRIDYGPITLIALDSSDGLPHKSAADTNHSLEGSRAPDFNPGSEQYRWFESQLADAQHKSRFTFVQFHHTAYGSGPHSIPFGQPDFSGQSGIAMRVIQPLLFRYGVDAVFSGHDEMLERSQVTGVETLSDGATRPHTIQFYDVGIGGDGLRGPSAGFDNPYRKFLAHENAPEVWKGRQLVSGGKHYGHLEVNVTRNAQGQWQAELTPVCAFPLLDAHGNLTGWERRTYDDVVTLTAPSEKKTAEIRADAGPNRAGFSAVLLLAGIAGAPFLARVVRRSPRSLRPPLP